MKKVFVKLFAKFFEVFAKFFKVFASFLRFSRAFLGFRIHSDPLGCIWMHSEAIGSVWTFSKKLRFLGFLYRFSTCPDVIFRKNFFHGTILVTNQLHFLNHAAVSNIVVMSKGCIVEQGRFDTLKANPESHFSELLKSVGDTHGEEKKIGERQQAEDNKTNNVMRSTVMPTSSKGVGSITGDKSGQAEE